MNSNGVSFELPKRLPPLSLATFLNVIQPLVDSAIKKKWKYSTRRNRRFIKRDDKIQANTVSPDEALSIFDAGFEIESNVSCT